MLEEYDYSVVYKTGKSNTNADALSRIPYADENEYPSINFITTHSKAEKELLNFEPAPISKKVSFAQRPSPISTSKKTFDQYIKCNQNVLLSLTPLVEKTGIINNRKYDFIVHITDDISKLVN